MTVNREVTGERLKFVAQRSPLNVRRSTFAVQRSPFTAQRSAFGVLGRSR
jgi:hypothetical protein